MENWKPIPGLPGYEASDTGQVRNHLGERLTHRLSPTGSGYLVCDAVVDGRIMTHSVSYLVAKTWVGMPTHGSDGVVVHADTNRHNNVPSNISWFKPDPKARRSFRLGASRPRAGGATRRT